MLNKKAWVETFISLRFDVLKIVRKKVYREVKREHLASFRFLKKLSDLNKNQLINKAM